MNRYYILGILATSSFLASSSEIRSISLDETILMARSRSVDAQVAVNAFKSAYWSYRSYRAELLPEVNFNATLPSYAKSYSAYQLENGSYTYVRNNYLNTYGQLSVDQSIWLTGGTLSLNTSLDFMRTLESPATNRYMSIPIALKLSQPIFAVNNVKWKRRIEPVRYEEAKADFIEATEKVAMTAINYYFNLLYSTENVEIEKQNVTNASKLYEVAKAKRKMGQISENDLLQLELNKIQAEANLTDALSNRQSNMFRLVAFLNLPEDTELIPNIPIHTPEIQIDYNNVLERALENNSFSKNLRRRQLEADYAVATAKGNLRQVTLYAQVGFTGTNNTFSAAYDRLKDNQIVEIGLKIPILDWGKRRGQVKVAESNRDLTKALLRQEAQTFNQDLFVLVERFNNQRQQVEIAIKADAIANKRYHTNYETFMIGKISTLDLNDSNTSKDQARLKVINELFNYWYYYYQLRSLTLWDFINRKSIDADFDKIVKD